MTVGALVDRLYRSLLEPPDFQPHMAFLSTSVDTAATQLVLSGFSLPEDEQFLQLGGLVEVDSELMRIDSYSPDTNTITLHTTGGRNKEGTDLASHAAGAVVKIGPSWSRKSVFEAVRDNIIALYPRLYTVRTVFATPIGIGTYPLEDELAVEVVRAVPDAAPDLDVHGRIVDHDPFFGHRAFRIAAGGNQGNLWITYRRRFDVAESEASTLENLGVESVWSWLICVGAAADLMIGRDVPQAQVDFVGRQIEAETKPVGSEASLALRLRQYQDFLIQQFSNEMDAEYRVSVTMRNPFQSVTGGLQ